MTKKLLIAIALILPFCVMAQDLKFGYFDRSKIFMSMPETVAASKKLDDLSKRYETEYTNMKEEYQKKGSDFVAVRDSLPESIKTRRMAEIEIATASVIFYSGFPKRYSKTTAGFNYSDQFEADECSKGCWTGE